VSLHTDNSQLLHEQFRNNCSQQLASFNHGHFIHLYRGGHVGATDSGLLGGISCDGFNTSERFQASASPPSCTLAPKIAQP
jgi:hypothetical protein